MDKSLEARVQLLEEQVAGLQQLLRPTRVAEIVAESCDFSTLSIGEALKVIAGCNGGILVSKDATKILVQNGMYEYVSEASHAVAVTARRTKMFQRIQPGVYRLLKTEYNS